MSILLLALLTCVPPGNIPQVPDDGYGLWLNSECEWEVVPCPGRDAFLTEDITIRLPVFCPILMPRIGYSVKTDTAVRRDLSKASRLIPALNHSLLDCRNKQDASNDECIELIERSKLWLNDCVKESTLQLQEVEELEHSHSVYKVWAISSTSVVAVLTLVVIIQGQL